MRKFLGIVLAAAMVISLAACGSSSDDQTTAATSQTEETTAAAPETTEAETETETEETTQQETTTVEIEKDFSATIDESILVDDMGVKITATGLSYNSYQAILDISIENNTDKELSFISGSLGYPMVFVNGYKVTDGYMNEDVAAGMTANETISFSLDELILFGIKDIAEIDIGFDIQEGYDDYFKTGLCVLKTSADAGYDYGADTFAEAMKAGVATSLYGFNMEYSSDEVIFEDSGVSVVNQYIGTNSDGEYLMFMEVKNDSDRDVYAAMTNVKINDLVVYSGTWDGDYIAAGKRAVMSIDLNDVIEPEYLEVLGMDEYSNLTFDFEVTGDDYYTEIASAEISIDIGDGGTYDYSGDVIYSENNITIMSVGLVEENLSYTSYIHALYLVKNDNDFEISIDDEDGAYVDKVKLYYTCYSSDIKPGDIALIDVKIDGDDFEDNDFEISNVSEVTMIFDIRDDSYNKIDEPSVTMTIAK